MTKNNKEIHGTSLESCIYTKSPPNIPKRRLKKQTKGNMESSSRLDYHIPKIEEIKYVKFSISIRI